MTAMHERFDKVDNATMYAIFGATGAAAAGWVFGVPPKQAAAIAAIPSLAAAALHTDKRDLAAKATYMTGAIFVFSKLAGLHQVSWRGGAAVVAGAAGGTFLWSYSPTHNLKRYRGQGRLLLLVYPVVGLIIGVVRPQWFKPLHGALFMGLMAIRRESWYQHHSLSNKSKGDVPVWSYVTTPIASSVGILTPLAATRLGFPTTYWPQYAIALGALNVVESLSRFVQDTWFQQQTTE